MFYPPFPIAHLSYKYKLLLSLEYSFLKLYCLYWFHQYSKTILTY
nr:MAG TPA: hypothetical protein [Bacteriophage sp.]